MRTALLAIAAAAIVIPMGVVGVDAKYYYTDCYGVYGFNKIVCKLHVEIHRLNTIIDDQAAEIKDLRQQLAEESEPVGYLDTNWQPIRAESQDYYNLNKAYVSLEQNRYDRGLFRAFFNFYDGGPSVSVVYHAEIWSGGSNAKEGVYDRRADGVGHFQFRSEGSIDDLRICVSEVNGREVLKSAATDPVRGAGNVYAECTSFGDPNLHYNAGGWR